MLRRVPWYRCAFCASLRDTGLLYMCSSWYNNWVTRRHARCNNENVFVLLIIELVVGIGPTVIRGLAGCTKFFHISHERHSKKNFFEHIIPFSIVYKNLSEIFLILLEVSRWRSWLRHWATNRKVAGSILDGVIGTFHWHNPSGRTMALGLTQPLTEMSTRNISLGVKAAGA